MPVVFVAASKLPTPFAQFTMHGFLDEATGREHVVLSLGEIADGAPVLGRLHSECLTGDALFSQRCDCGSQLEAALKAIAHACKAEDYRLKLVIERFVLSELFQKR